MPNPLGRRRDVAASSGPDDVTKLKQELEALKAQYAVDMHLISTDMSNLNQQIAASGTV